MNLHLLRRTSGLSVHYDSGNDWLFLDWEGEMTLPVVQQACLAIADCYRQRPYARILNNNDQVTGVSWNVAIWLVSEFLPHMRLVGIEHIAWICSPDLPGLNTVYTVLSWLPNSPITTFHDIADAVDWLKHIQAGQRDSPPPRRSPALQAQVEQVVQALHAGVAAKHSKWETA